MSQFFRINEVNVEFRSFQFRHDGHKVMSKLPHIIWQGCDTKTTCRRAEHRINIIYPQNRLLHIVFISAGRHQPIDIGERLMERTVIGNDLMRIEIVDTARRAMIFQINRRREHAVMHCQIGAVAPDHLWSAASCGWQRRPRPC